MTTTSHLTLIAAGSAFLFGCAAIDSDVKVPSGAYDSHLLFRPWDNIPSTNFTATAQTNSTPQTYADKLNWVMPLMEVDDSRFLHPKGISVKDSAAKDKPPLFLAYDTSKIEAGLFEVIFAYDGPLNSPTGGEEARARNDLVKRILYRSDCNFDAYASRLRTFEKSDALASDTLDEISTATIGTTALVAPPVAAGLAAGKLLAQGTTKNIEKDFFSGQTADVLLKAMAANRELMKTKIEGKLYVSATNAPPGGAIAPYRTYSMFDVLGDVRSLNEASSVYGTLETISQTADNQTQAAQNLAAKMNTTQTGASPKQVDDAAAGKTSDSNSSN